MNSLVMVSETNEYSAIPTEEMNMTNVKNIIHKNDHPHPVILCVIVIVLMIVIYYIYVAFIKVCFNGKWISNNENRGFISLKHNKWNDSVIVDDFIKGYVKGNAIYLHVNNKISLGILYDNNIYWLNGDVWKRPIHI